jgi:uncharacterized membrane protein YdjX (TVP38/TMEM64 family)
MTRTPAQTITNRMIRMAPIVLIALAAIIALVFFRHWLSFDRLGENRLRLIELRDQYYLATSIGFIVLYTLVVVISIPGALILTLSGGFLFGLFPGLIYNICSATLGAIIVFSAARTGFGHELAARIEARGGAVARLQQALKENQITVLLTMRLIPVLPFFISNLAPALVGVRFWTFAITTFFGIIPADVIYTQLGAGLGDVFARGEKPNLHILFTPQFGLPLLGLALLSLAPLVVKLVNRRRG